MKKIKLPIMYDNVQKIVRTCELFMQYFDIDFKYGRHSVDAISYLGVLSFCNHTVDVIPLIAALKDEIDEEKVEALFEALQEFGAYREE